MSLLNEGSVAEVEFEDLSTSNSSTLNNEEEEELPSLSNSPEEIEIATESVQVEDNGTPDTVPPEDELLSLSRSPATITPESEVGDSSHPSEVNHQEELLSLSNSPSGSSSLADRNQENNGETPQNSNLPEDPSPSTPLIRVDSPVAGPSNLETPTSAHKIRGFRTRIDENGETVFEFASDESEQDEGDAEMYEPEEPRPEPPAPIASTSSASANINNLQEQLNIIRTLQSVAHRVAHQRVRVRRAIPIPDYDSSDDDPDYVPGEGPIPDHTLGSNTDPDPGSQVQVQSSTHRRRRVVRGGRVKRKRGRKAVKRKNQPPKPKIPTIRKPPKPLVPKVIIEDEDGNETSEYYKSQLSKFSVKGNRISIGVNNSNSEIEDSYLKVGEAFLLTNNDTNAEYGSEDLEKLGEKFPGLKNFILYANEFEDFSMVELRTEQTLSSEESALRPKPRLNKQDSKRELIFVIRKSYFYPCTIDGYPVGMFCSAGFGNKKVFHLSFHGYNAERNGIQLNIMISKDYIRGPHNLNDIPYGQSKIMIEALNSIFNVQSSFGPCPWNDDETNRDQKEDIPWFYGQVKKYHAKEELPSPSFSLQHECVAPILRPYQKNAVHWMLYRENVFDNCAGGDGADASKVILVDAFREKMYIPISICDQAAFYNPHVGYICWNTPTFPTLQSGGILADEMGLGKTVEVISLIVLHPRPKEEYELPSPTFEELSESEEISSTDSESDESNHQVDTDRTRSRKSGRNIRKQVNYDETNEDDEKDVDVILNSDSDSDSSNQLLHPKLRNRRNVSPCSFTVGVKVDTHASSEKSLVEGVNDNSPSTSTSIASLVQQPQLKKRRKKASSGIPRKLLKTEAPKTTYQRLKAVYDTQLNEYCEARRVISNPVFHGKFYETNIERRACFECICGGDNDDSKIKVLQCSICHSSQHAKCVGLDKKMINTYALNKKKYLCPHCLYMQEPYPAKTTLIVTPPSISGQWVSELKRHIKNKSVSIFFYKGVNHHGYLPPAKLGEYDIVITTYNVLASELNYVDLPHTNSEDGRRFRNPKRFMTIPSSLPCVFWWRICLDEAQMVEGINTKMSLMAQRLPAVHRWGITGTPLNKGLQDLFGLFAFLGVKPIDFDFWWDKLVLQPFYQKDVSLLYEVFGQLIWRTGKQDVLDQLGIPPQTSVVRWLSFSAIEEHFYKQQYEICSNKILEKIAKLGQSNANILESRLTTLDRQVLQSLLLPFLELRKACCHPQIVKGQSISLQKGTMTMDELLVQLLKKSSLQCADDHRQVVAALNGMAGIHMIREEWFSASERYREVLQSSETNKKHFTTDSLQLLHTFENLSDLLDRNHSSVPYTLRDGSLRAEAEEVKKKYLEKYSNGIELANATVEPITKATEELFDQFVCDPRMSWWAATLSKATKLGKAEDLVKRIKDELTIVDTKKTTNVISTANKFNDVHGLENILVGNITKIEDLRMQALSGLENLKKEDPSLFVAAAVSCHLRKNSQLYYKGSDEVGFRCQICQYHDKFIQYESFLFAEIKKNKVVRTGRKWQQNKILGDISSDLTEEERNLVLLKEEEELIESLEEVNVNLIDELRRGTWGDSDTEKILKLINNFARINKLAKDIRDDGSTHMKLFDTMKREFRVLRILWRKIYDQISGMDELSQATTRLCLKYKGPTSSGVENGNSQEPPSTSTGSARRKKKPKELQSTQIDQDQRIQNINVLEPHELDFKMNQMESDLQSGKDTLSIHLGQLLYLKTLKKNDYRQTGNINTEECPVCHNQLGMEYTVLRCGHSYCSECVKKMCPNFRLSFLCPLCRHSMKYSDVSFIDNRGTTASPSKHNPNKRRLKGSHSTKVEAILETLLQLQDSHPGEKIIIFSTWPDVLEIIAKALDQNDIRNYFLNQSGKKFQTELDRFKTREDAQVLLMPLASGSKGLNLTEATHILLVEPILNLASELQCIGRIHRIGQTKPTFVHRFYIKNTIEEQLFEVLKTHDVSSDKEGALTVADLRNLIRDGKDYDGPNSVTLD